MVERSFDCSRFCLGLLCVGRSIGLCLGFYNWREPLGAIIATVFPPFILVYKDNLFFHLPFSNNYNLWV